MSGFLWITLWNREAAHWCDAMGGACWQGGLFILTVWAACRLWKRIPPTVRYGLWWAACLKLMLGLFPVFIALPLLPPAVAPIPMTAVTNAPPHRQAMVARAEQLSAVPVAHLGRQEPQLSGQASLLISWLTVTALLIGLTAHALFRLHRLIRTAEPLSDPALLQMANEAALAIGIRAAPRILVTPAEISVLMVGAVRPTVLLSQSALSACSPSELRLVLAHEFAHIRRGDAWLGLLPQLTQILFWFHPLAWLACRELNLAREAACDEQTISSLQARPDLYGRLLLKLGVRHTAWFALCIPGVSSHFRILHRRISMLAQISEGSPRRRGFVVLFACLMGAALMVPWNIVRAQNPTGNLGNAAATEPASPAPRPTAGGGNMSNQVLGASKRAQTQTGDLKNGTGKVLAVHQTKPPAAASVKQTATTAKSAPPVGTANPGTAVTKPSDKTRTTAIPNEGESPKPAVTTRIFKLQNAQADTVAKTLETLFGDKEGKSVKIVPDARTNVIVLQASDDKSMEIFKILRELDADTTESSRSPRLFVRVFPLRFAHAEDLAVTLSQLYEDKTGKTVQVAADPRTNALIIRASEEQTDVILNLVRQLDIEHKQP